VDPKRLVREGYERAASEYEAWSARVDARPRSHYLTVLADLVEPGAKVLELGCGTGLATSDLAERFDVVGVDFSTACLERARWNAPRARYVQADITRLGIRPTALDAVVAFYSLIHVPRHEQGEVFGQAAQWLRPGGVFVATLGSADLPAGTDDDWRGVEMYWSSYDVQTNLALAGDAGFDVLSARVVPQEEDGKIFSFLWLVARSRTR
jgi:SAM-dependent methyltransferase